MEISTTFLVLIPIVIGVVEAIKKLGLPSRFAPSLSIILGIAAVYVAGNLVLSGALVIEGIVVGLSAAGLDVLV